MEGLFTLLSLSVVMAIAYVCRCLLQIPAGSLDL